jgi:Secretion system C-terminal sorting domain
MKHFLLLLSFVALSTFATAQTSASQLPDLKVFPNPTTEFIAVNDQQDQVGYLVLFNIMGRKVREITYNRGERYSILDLPKGIYLVQIQDKNQKLLHTQKIEKR